MSRFRPIMLTAVSTVLGLIPIAVTIFWGPMAIAVMGGLLVATVLTLIFLPALYVAWFRIKEPAVMGEDARCVAPQPWTQHEPGPVPVGNLTYGGFFRLLDRAHRGMIQPI